ncbi:unnamed protein product [Ranitomeya imitator]|uniref:Uncharacterized protein n=1 Tax=Ranitomeya imitator TaxID=111125 RepID=A0ABN9L4H5_9NEOB|nr:unnamed protein product [Ranitomeya imitator]
MERQGPMTPVVREASGPDTGAPIAGSDVCAAALAQFKDAMAQFGVPLSPEKTIGPVPVITFLGIEIDSVAMEFRLPKEKIDKLLDLISGCISVGFTGTAPSGALGGGGLPTFDLGCPGDLMPLIRSSIAPSTWKAYGKAWEEWCLLADGKPVGSSEEARMQVTMAFLSKMHAMGVSGSVARNRVSALAFHFKLRGWPDSTKHFLVSQLLKGWRRADRHGDNRRPISFDLLVSLVKALEPVCDSKYEAALMSAAFGLAFFGAMRVSEIVPTALNKPVASGGKTY